MKKLLKSPVLRYLVLGILAAAVGLNLYNLNAVRLTGNAAPMPFGYGVSVVLSGSMEPALSVGDLLIVRAYDQYAAEDIVVYQSGSTPIVHRIVEINSETVITRGDANNTDDEPFPVSEIKGKVIAIVPLVGYVAWALKSPVAAIILLGAAVLLMEWSFRVGKSQKEDEKEKLKAEIRALMEELKEN